MRRPAPSLAPTRLLSICLQCQLKALSNNPVRTELATSAQPKRRLHYRHGAVGLSSARPNSLSPSCSTTALVRNSDTSHTRPAGRAQRFLHCISPLLQATPVNELTKRVTAGSGDSYDGSVPVLSKSRRNSERKNGSRVPRHEASQSHENAGELEKAQKKKERRKTLRERRQSKKAAALKDKPKDTTESDKDAHETATVKPSAKSRAAKNKKLKDSEPRSNPVTLLPKDLVFAPLSIEQPPVPRLAHNLDRALFNRGVYNLRDRYSGVYNFDPYLENVMPAAEFNFDALAPYKNSSEDDFLAKTAADNNLRYVGSTSSMTSMLTHFHYLLSHWRELNISELSRGFKISDSKNSRNFTEIYRAPQAVFLRYKDGTYAIDADREYSTPNILMAMGHSLEKLLTLPVDKFERFRRSDPRGVPEEEQSAPQSYHYSKQGRVLMRSQLDAYDPRLPGSGVFDLKTRAVLPIRMSAKEIEQMKGYQIVSDAGTYESYEREFYDMFRSTFLKYSLQVRMGRMEGIFIAYHNVEEIFGFQFMSLAEMDRVLHGQEDPCLGDQEFRASVDLVHKIMDEATTDFPEKSIRLHFETRPGVVPMMYIFAEPMEEAEIEEIQTRTSDAIKAFEQEIRGEAPEDTSASAPSSPTPEETAEIERPLLAWTLTAKSYVNHRPVPRPEALKPTDTWEIKYELSRINTEPKARSLYATVKARRAAILLPPEEPTTAAQQTDPDDPTSLLLASDKPMSIAEALAPKPAAATAPPQPGPKKVRRRRPLPQHYLDILRNLAARGRQMREERLKEDEGIEKVVVGLEGLAKNADGLADAATTSADGEHKEEVMSVQGYMAWLFGKK